MVAPDLNRPSFGKLDFEAIVPRRRSGRRRRRPARRRGRQLAGRAGGPGGGAAGRSRRRSFWSLRRSASAGAGSRSWRRAIRSGSSTTGRGGSSRSTAGSSSRWRTSRVDRDPPPQRVVVIMGEEDESVPVRRRRGNLGAVGGLGSAAAGLAVRLDTRRGPRLDRLRRPDRGGPSARSKGVRHEDACRFLVAILLRARSLAANRSARVSGRD